LKKLKIRNEIKLFRTILYIFDYNSKRSILIIAALKGNNKRNTQKYFKKREKKKEFNHFRSAGCANPEKNKYIRAYNREVTGLMDSLKKKKKKVLFFIFLLLFLYFVLLLLLSLFFSSRQWGRLYIIPFQCRL
jgi:hypothetical protein